MAAAQAREKRLGSVPPPARPGRLPCVPAAPHGRSLGVIQRIRGKKDSLISLGISGSTRPADT